MQLATPYCEAGRASLNYGHVRRWRFGAATPAIAGKLEWALAQQSCVEPGKPNRSTARQHWLLTADSIIR